MNSIINTTSYLGLFLIAILSFTILPGPSEAVMLGMISIGFAPITVLLVATLGGIVARGINYLMGSLGEEFVVTKKKWLKPRQVERSKKLFNKYGTAVLIFTWLPIIDDPLTVVAGFFKFPFLKYLLYTTTAILIRHLGLYLIYLIFT